VTRYRHTHLVDAFQFDPHAPIQCPGVRHGFVPGHGECWHLDDNGARHVLEAGVWLVLYETGFVVFSDADFRANFEVANVDDVMRTRDEVAKITVELEATRGRAKRLGIQLAEATAELRTLRLTLNGFRKLEEIRGVVPPRVENPNEDPPGTFRCAVCSELVGPNVRPLKEVQNTDCRCMAFARIGPCCRAALNNAPEEVDRVLRASAHAKDCKNR
jgi:hypothetical protein